MTATRRLRAEPGSHCEKGSTARKHGVDSWTSYRNQRADLVDNGKLVDGADPQLLVFADNVAFDSPSAAAAVVLAANVNGRTAWKTADGTTTYADWQERQLKLAGVESAPDDRADISDG